YSLNWICEIAARGLRSWLGTTHTLSARRTRIRGEAMIGKKGASKSFVPALCAGLLALSSIAWAADDDKSDIEKRIQNAATVLDEIMAVKDKAIPDKVMSDAECVAVVPSMVKIAIGIGGNHGKGVATCKTANGWSAPAPFTITGGSWGLQIGAQGIDLVMLVM